MDELGLLFSKKPPQAQIREYIKKKEQEAHDSAVMLTEYRIRKDVCDAIGVRFN